MKKTGEEKYPDLVFVSYTNELGSGVLTCCRRDVYDHPPLGLVSRVQIVVDQDGKYDFQVLLFSKEKGSISTTDEYLALCDRIAAKGRYKFCPGINPETYKTTYYDVIRYNPKRLRRTMHPVQRADRFLQLHPVAQTSKEC